jgi:chloramphenicol 3-O-phosphotransferase
MISRFRLRGLDVAVDADTAELEALVSRLVCRAADRDPVRATASFRLRAREDGRIDLEEDGRAPRTMTDAAAAAAAVHRRLGIRLSQLYRDCTRLHAGAVTVDGRLIVIAGSRGAGKTTLLLRLAIEGAAFHCDEHVMAGADGLVRTMPRPLHVKAGTLPWLPDVARVCDGRPMLALPGGPPFHPLDPAELGLNWRSLDAEPAAFVRLTPSFSEPPRLAPMTQIEMVRTLIVESAGEYLSFGRQARDVTAVVRGTPCFGLRVGDLEATARALRLVCQ